MHRRLFTALIPITRMKESFVIQTVIRSHIVVVLIMTHVVIPHMLLGSGVSLK